MDTVTIRFKNAEEITAEQNGDCYITEAKPDFPDDLSYVIIVDAVRRYALRDVAIVDCASIDGRYWFVFRELSPGEIRERELESTIQMLTDCLLEISEQIYS